MELAELIRDRISHVEMLRFVSRGTEATMSLLRVARATGRSHMLNCEGCYHGHADAFMVGTSDESTKKECQEGPR